MSVNLSVAKKICLTGRFFFAMSFFLRTFASPFDGGEVVVAVLPAERREVNGTTESEVARVCGLAYF